jgi:2'-5' RNA ligase
MNSSLSKSASPPVVRTFLAVEIPEKERDALASIIHPLEPVSSSLKLVAPQLLHITMRFLGGVPAQDLGRVNEAAQRAASCVSPFSVTLSGVGAFPNPRAPRVIWAGIAEDAGLRSLRSLASQLEDALAVEGFARDSRPFSPHITLARARDGISREQRQGLALALGRLPGRGLPQRTFDVGGLTVMRSDLRPSGPIYTRLYVAPLQGGD